MVNRNIKPYTGRIFRSGNSYVMIVPKYLIRAGVVDIKKKYHVNISEVENV